MTQQVLQSAGLWPFGDTSSHACRMAPGENILPLLVDVWRQVVRCGSAKERRNAQAKADRIEILCDLGAALTTGVAGCHPAVVADWIGARIAWWPDGIPTQRRVALLSSHLGREPDSRAVWFTALRAACTKVDAVNDLLVTTRSVTTDRFVRRCHELFEIPLLDILLPKQADASLSTWGKSILQHDPGSSRPGVVRLSLSPVPAVAHMKAKGPLADRAMIAVSDRLIVLSLQRRGRLLPLIERRVGDPRWHIPSVTLATGDDLIPSTIAQPLLDRGAVAWILLDTLKTNTKIGGPNAEQRPFSARPGSPGIKRCPTAPIIPVPSGERWQYLTHWTRHHVGPWPEQKESDYFDDLIFQRPASDHSALACVKRIVRQRRIAASSSAIRGATPVVSFTALPLKQFPNMRVFRPHRARWDFEPYGICIRRDWLGDQGARPVIYGDETTWNQLSDAERPFFQLARSGSDATAKFAWTRELEWRHVGAVDLSTVPDDAALLFVRTRAEAESLVEQSDWPIAVLAEIAVT